MLGQQMANGLAFFQGGVYPFFDRFVRLAGDGHGGFRHGFQPAEPVRLLDVFSTLGALLNSKSEPQSPVDVIP